MKYCAYWVLLILLLSCGRTTETPTNLVRINFRTSTTQEYYLLAVRGSTLVVASGEKAPLSSAKIITFSKIRSVDQGSDGKFVGGVLGGLVGVGAVAAASTIAASLSLSGIFTGLIVVGFISIPTFIAGAEIGCDRSTDSRQYLPSIDDDRKWLKYIAKFHDVEPPELQNIK